MDFETDKYDLFNAPQYVDFNEFVRTDGFRNDNADDFFETHREEDDFFPTDTLSPTAQLLLQSSEESDIQIIHHEAPKSKPASAKASPVISKALSEKIPKCHPTEQYPGTGMFTPLSPTTEMPRPTSTDVTTSSKGISNYYYSAPNGSTLEPQQQQPQEHYSQYMNAKENCPPEMGMGGKRGQQQGQTQNSKWPIELTSSEEVIMREESVKSVNTALLEKSRRIAELEQLEKARIKAELEKAEKLRIKAELEKSEKLRLQLELEKAEHIRREAEAARMEKLRIQAELERIEKARMEAEQKAEQARLEVENERQEKARIQAELEKLEKQRLPAQQLKLEKQYKENLNEREQDLETKLLQEQVRRMKEASQSTCGDNELMESTAARTLDAQTESSHCVGDNNGKYPASDHEHGTELDGQAYQPMRLDTKKHYYYDQHQHAAHPDYNIYNNLSQLQEHHLPLGSETAASVASSGFQYKVLSKMSRQAVNSKMSFNKVTVPQPFKFSELRPRKAPAAQETETEVFRFRPGPAPLKALHVDPVSGGPQKSLRMKATQPTEFHFASDDRIRERHLKRQSQPNPSTKKEVVTPGMGRKSRAERGSPQQQYYQNPNQNLQRKIDGTSTVNDVDLKHGYSTETVKSVVSVDGAAATNGSGGMLRKSRLRSRSSSADGTQRGVSPMGTQIMPFSFEERDREKLKKKEEKIRNAIKAEIPIRNFHAQKVPNYSLSLKRLPKKKPAPPTCVEPFNFKCDQRGFAYQEEVQRRTQEEYLLSKQKAEFVAQPNQVIYKKPYEPERSSVPLVEPLDIVMNSDRRAEDRAKFDSMIKGKEAELEELRKKDKIFKEEQESKLSQAIRQLCVHRAKPAPKSRAFEVKSSDKPLTEPKSPAFELLPSQRHPRNFENKDN